MRALLVASAGGHLKELHRLRGRLAPRLVDVVWVTSTTAQSRSLLAGEAVLHVPVQGSRSCRTLPTDFVTACREIGRYRPHVVVSTGAGVAVPYLAAARSLGVQAHYIECGARVTGPSLTGRLLERLPGIHLYNQHGRWPNPRWHYRGSVYEGFHPGRVKNSREVSQVVVAVGSWHGFGFPRLIERLLTILPRHIEVLWQTGYTDVNHLPVKARPWVSLTDLTSAMRLADVIIAHAGTGSALDALESGKCPILVPRRRNYGEHVDDHQTQLAEVLDRRGLALRREPEDLTVDDLFEAASRSVVTVGQPASFRLLKDLKQGQC